MQTLSTKHHSRCNTVSVLMEYANVAASADWIHNPWTFSQAYNYLKISYFTADSTTSKAN